MYRNFVGTRGTALGQPDGVFFTSSILNPDASFGGLFVPQKIPRISAEDMKKLQDSRYIDLAFHILRHYGVELGNNQLYEALHRYDDFDDPANPVPTVQVSKKVFVAELYHGPTRAFKDMALQPFPKLLSTIAQSKNENYLVLAATSGDTGPAALDGFRDLPNTKVVCLYPHGGTSDIQRLQMVTEEGKNLKVLGIEGDFDDAQTALKNFMKSDEFKAKLAEKGYMLSAANSVNFGRIVFQVVYHFWSYFQLVKQERIKFGDKVTYIIPSGNFGNGLAAYYAMKMGLPIKKIILASNTNNVLTDFVETGVYDLRERKLVKTTSPAMDILKSSNVERLLYDLFGPERTKQLMEDLEDKKFFELNENELFVLKIYFSASFATDDEVSEVMKKTFEKRSYVIDPHTATGFVARKKLGIKGVCVICSTAEWTKFSETVAKAHGVKNDFGAITKKLGVKLPKQIASLSEKPENHTMVVPVTQIEDEILNFL